MVGHQTKTINGRGGGGKNIDKVRKSGELKVVVQYLSQTALLCVIEYRVSCVKYRHQNGVKNEANIFTPVACMM